jgi:ureidoacrylate peracid hydrolase
MQNDYCNARGVYPRQGLNCFDMNNVVPATVAAVTTCKTRAIPVIYLRMAWNTDAHGFPIDAGLIIEQSRPFIRTEGLRRGTWGAEVLAEMPPPDYDVEKTRYSGFHNTALDALLRGLDIDTIFLTGVITNMCVEATARDAFHRDFRFVVLSDCVSGFSRKLHDASLETLQIFGRVATSSDLSSGG